MTDDEQLWADLGKATPTYATRPAPGAPNLLAQAAIIGETLGTPMIPWQRYVTRVASERLDNGRYRYPLVILTTPRQVGKTTLFRVLQTTKCIMQPHRRAYYTAQTGKDASARWRDLVDGIESSPLGDQVEKRLAAGGQSLRFPNGSFIAPFAPTAESLHGYTPHDVTVDECFAFDDQTGDDLMGAIGPAQITIPDRQLFLVSTAGNRDSTWLRRWVDYGRDHVTDAQGVAYFEWSMPAGLDPNNPDSWRFHPALDHLITIDDLLEERDRHPEGDWLRYYMNRWSDTTEATLFSGDELDAVNTPQTPPSSTTSLVLAFEVAVDRSRSVIKAAWVDPATGRPAVKTAWSCAGTEGLLAKIVALSAEWHPRAIVADDGGPTRDVLDQLEATTQLEVTRGGARDFATACDALTARIRNRLISVDMDPDTRAGFSAIVTRPMGQGWAFDRRKSPEPIPEPIATAVALRVLETQPVQPKPYVWSPA